MVWNPVGPKAVNRIKQPENQDFFPLPGIAESARAGKKLDKVLPLKVWKEKDHIFYKNPTSASGEERMILLHRIDNDDTCKNGCITQKDGFIYEPQTDNFQYRRKYELKAKNLKGKELQKWKNYLKLLEDPKINPTPTAEEAKKFYLSVLKKKSSSPATGHQPSSFPEGHEKSKESLEKFQAKIQKEREKNQESANKFEHAKDDFPRPKTVTKGAETEKTFSQTHGKILHAKLRDNKAPIEKIKFTLRLIVSPSTGEIQRVLFKNVEWLGEASWEQVRDLLDIMAIALNKTYRFNALDSYVITKTVPLIKQAGN